MTADIRLLTPREEEDFQMRPNMRSFIPRPGRGTAWCLLERQRDVKDLKRSLETICTIIEEVTEAHISLFLMCEQVPKRV